MMLPMKMYSILILALLASEPAKADVGSNDEEDDDANSNPDKKLARLLAGVL